MVEAQTVGRHGSNTSATGFRDGVFPSQGARCCGKRRWRGGYSLPGRMGGQVVSLQLEEVSEWRVGAQGRRTQAVGPRAASGFNPGASIGAPPPRRPLGTADVEARRLSTRKFQRRRGNGRQGVSREVPGRAPVPLVVIAAKG